MGPTLTRVARARDVPPVVTTPGPSLVSWILTGRWDPSDRPPPPRGIGTARSVGGDDEDASVAVRAVAQHDGAQCPPARATDRVDLYLRRSTPPARSATARRRLTRAEIRLALVLW